MTLYILVFLSIFYGNFAQIQDFHIEDLARELNETVENLQTSIFNITYIAVNRDKISFLLLTPRTGPGPLIVDAANASLFMNPEFPTKMIIHAWYNDPSTDWVKRIVKSYQKKANYNIIVVDWSSVSYKNYVKVTMSSKPIGDIIGDFIADISHDLGPNFLRNLHVIGFSLAGQITGFVGKRVQEIVKNKIGRITGLDVAAPLFEFPVLRPPTDRLAETDAAFVDLIHTQVITKGVVNPFGDVDFYVNPGQLIQNGCHQDLPNLNAAVSCGHLVVDYFFIRTILNPQIYIAVKCDSSDNFLAGVCDNNEKVAMGDAVPKTASGTFYVIIDAQGRLSKPEAS